MSTLSTHILDIALGQPASGVGVQLFVHDDDSWTLLTETETNDDGRVSDVHGESLEAGVYRLRFATGAYFDSRGDSSFYPWTDVVFIIRDTSEHYHVPLLLSPFGYSTYRGSLI